jgi:hypothetical protein
MKSNILGILCLAVFIAGVWAVFNVIIPAMSGEVTILSRLGV